jgi:hypothetical protein
LIDIKASEKMISLGQFDHVYFRRHIAHHPLNVHGVRASLVRKLQLSPKDHLNHQHSLALFQKLLITPHLQWAINKFTRSLLDHQPLLAARHLTLAALLVGAALVFVALALVAVALKMVCLAACAALKLPSPTISLPFVLSLRKAGPILKSGGVKLRTSP